MTIMNDRCPSSAEVAHFLADYCAKLLGSGATYIRLEKNASRIARAYGKTVEITTMPRHINLSVSGGSGDYLDTVTVVASVRQMPISYYVNTRLSELSWMIADGRIGFDAARSAICDIVSSDIQSRWLVLLLVTVANASFCRLFGGDAAAMAIVAAATFAGYCLKIELLRYHVDVRVVFIACSFVSGVLGASGLLFSIGSTPQIALATSVLYLVPGIPFLNSFSDMLYRHYICAFSRFADAVILTCCLSAGLSAAMMLMRVGMF